MTALAQKANIGLNLTGKVAAVSGGTQGIGASVSRRFAEAGASVYIIGRNAELGDKVVEELRALSAARVIPEGSKGEVEGKFEFIKADLSLISGIKDVANQLEAKSGEHGIDFLVQTQGGPPRGIQNLTSESHDQHFVVQCLSRFGLSYLLASSNTLKESIVNVCAPTGKGTSSPPDLNDLELIEARKRGEVGGLMSGFGIISYGMRDGAVVDGFTAEFATAFPNLTTHHIFPGVVQTSALSNQNFPKPLVLLSNLFGPLIFNSSKTYAEIPVYLAANKDSRGKGLEFSNEKLKVVGMPDWCKQEGGVRKELWEKMKGLLEV